jgi:ABC-2 type transport system permease protein
MSTTTHATEPTAPVLPAYPGDQKVTEIGVLHAEWTKLRSLPSAAWSLLSAVALITVVGALYALLRSTHPPHGASAIASFDPTAISLSGIQVAQLATGVLGVLVITSEYATGQLFSTLAAVPRRLAVLRGKAAVVAVATLAASLPATFAAFLTGQSVLSSHHLSTTLGQPGVTRAVIGGALYLTAIALLGLGLGAILRTAAGGIATLLGVMLGLPILAGFLPGTLSDQIGKYLPTQAGQAVASVHPDATMLGPWTGLGLLFGYVIVALGLGAWLLRRRDV